MRKVIVGQALSSLRDAAPNLSGLTPTPRPRHREEFRKSMIPS
jgi:hypothetical protein